MSGRRIVILGGGMAGMAAAWRLSEPGWRHNYEAITLFQRGWRLGGKGASSRGVHGRIEEHGLHIWLGYYENAFRLLRECYAELDRPRTDPEAPVQSWHDALVPSTTVGLEEPAASGWSHWLGDFAANDLVPGEPDAPGEPMSVEDWVRRALGLVADFLGSLPGGAGLLQVLQNAGGTTGSGLPDPATLEVLVSEAGEHLAEVLGHEEEHGRGWALVSVVMATMRGIVVDGLLTNPDGFRAINDEDYRAWIRRHGASEDAVQSTLVRGLYDLVFAQDDRDPSHTSFGAGWGVFLSAKTFFDYKGAIFWKMTAGMGDVVFAPLYQALRRRGVDFEFFHRVDALDLSDDGLTVDAVRMGRQVALRPGVERYEPLVRVKGLPCFPDRPLVGQLDAPEAIAEAPLEHHWCEWPDAEERVLRRGEDFDDIVLATSLGMVPLVCAELVARRPEWRAMTDHVRTVATQAFQVWLGPSEEELGWAHPGVTTSGYQKPFDTWASMPQVLPAEDWPVGDRPRTVAYFCGTLVAASCPDADEARRARAQVHDDAVRFLCDGVSHHLPGFAWDLLCGSRRTDPGAFDSQFWTANVDPSDRYVQSFAGTDRYRLRPDESGLDNLYLAGDWTDCGLNAGCIEAAVLAGLQAANAAAGRGRRWRIAGSYLL